jgi:hypothetical protein
MIPGSNGIHAAAERRARESGGVSGATDERSDSIRANRVIRQVLATGEIWSGRNLRKLIARAAIILKVHETRGVGAAVDVANFFPAARVAWAHSLGERPAK